MATHSKCQVTIANNTTTSKGVVISTERFPGPMGMIGVTPRPIQSSFPLTPAQIARARPPLPTVLERPLETFRRSTGDSRPSQGAPNSQLTPLSQSLPPDLPLDRLSLSQFIDNWPPDRTYGGVQLLPVPSQYTSQIPRSMQTSPDVPLGRCDSAPSEISVDRETPEPKRKQKAQGKGFKLRPLISHARAYALLEHFDLDQQIDPYNAGVGPTVRVNNLPVELTAQQIEREFSQAGNIIKIELKERRLANEADIEYESAEDATVSIRMFSGAKCLDNQIAVHFRRLWSDAELVGALPDQRTVWGTPVRNNWAFSRLQTRGVYVQYWPQEMDKKWAALFKQDGVPVQTLNDTSPVVDEEGLVHQRGVAIVVYDSIETAARVVERLHHYDHKGRHCRVNFSRCFRVVSKDYIVGDYDGELIVLDERPWPARGMSPITVQDDTSI